MAEVAPEGEGGEGGRGKQPSMRTMLLMRRKLSTWKHASAASGAGGADSAASREKSSSVPLPPVRYENTYRMEPARRFDVRAAEGEMMASMKFFLASQPGYNASKCATMTRLLVDDIKQRLKKQGYGRHKLVVQAFLAQENQQCLQMASQSVWDARHDTSATVTYTVKDIIATATVHAVYVE
jgi:hypothetical protein